MAKTLEARATREGTIAFEPERFEFVDGERLELSGRWFGVRGRRFMRPSLVLMRDDGETRLLADLVHKPWGADDGEPWEAAFPCAGGDLDDAPHAELTVSPDITVTLPAPAAAGRSRTAKRHKAPAPSASPPRPARKAEPSAEQRQIAELRARVESLTRELSEQRARYKSELGQAQTSASEALLARDRASEERDRAAEERDRAVAERNDATEERGQALQERDRAVAEREHAVREGQRASSDRDDGLMLTERAAAERDAALADRDDALAAAAQAEAERAAALAAQEQLRIERDQLVDARARLQSDYDETVRSHGAALVMRNATIDPVRHGRQPVWLGVAIFVLMVVVAVLIVAIVAR